ncbi:MAG TPA: hypothetical protein VIO32_09805 [Candidatus Baltobacteraceae bacterium]
MAELTEDEKQKLEAEAVAKYEARLQARSRDLDATKLTEPEFAALTDRLRATNGGREDHETADILRAAVIRQFGGAA